MLVRSAPEAGVAFVCLPFQFKPTSRQRTHYTYKKHHAIAKTCFEKAKGIQHSQHSNILFLTFSVVLMPLNGSQASLKQDILSVSRSFPLKISNRPFTQENRFNVCPLAGYTSRIHIYTLNDVPI